MEEKYININQENNLDLDNLDTIMELIGELLINKSRLESLELLKGESKDILSQLDRVTM
jgi:two-component system chemotaxis sensor kinase CheA